MEQWTTLLIRIPWNGSNQQKSLITRMKLFWRKLKTECPKVRNQNPLVKQIELYINIYIIIHNNWRYDKNLLLKMYRKSASRFYAVVTFGNFRIASCSKICQLIPFKTTHEALQTQAPDFSNECNEITASKSIKLTFTVFVLMSTRNNKNINCIFLSSRLT